MEAKATPSHSDHGGLWVDIFGELSYSSHAIPPKPEYPNMKIKTKTTTQNASTVLDSLENIFEPKVHK